MTNPRVALDLGTTVPRTAMRQWMAVLSLTLGTFVLITSELLPVGLLPNIAAELRLPAGLMGLTMTAPGLVAAVAAPMLHISTARFDRRLLFWLMSAALVVSNVLVAVSSDMATLMLGRVLLGFCIGGFWAAGAAAVIRMVEPSSIGRALALLFAGVSAGTVLGLPVGTFIGISHGWRVAFLGCAGLCLGSLLCQLMALPRLRPTSLVEPGHLWRALSNRRLIVVLVATGLVITGHMMAYTYLSIFLQGHARFSGEQIAGSLFVFGVAGLVGNSIAVELHRYGVQNVMTGVGAALGITLIFLSAFGVSLYVVFALVAVWGLLFGAVPVSLQAWIFSVEPEAKETGSALFVCVFQFALAIGSWIGGVIVDASGTVTVTALAGVVVMAMAAVACTRTPS